MATEWRLRRARVAALVMAIVATAPPITVGVAEAAASPAPPPPAAPSPAPPNEPWWVRGGLGHAPVRALAVRSDGALLIGAGGDGYVSRDGGRTVQRLASGGPPPNVGAGCPSILDPPVPMVICASPAGLPGSVVGVAADGAVWRRSRHGGWGRSLLLLPAGGLHGIPTITSITAFGDAPVTDAVYLGTDGYSVLETTDGGDEWLRADAGLPGRVFAVAADAGHASVYAGTDDGLWVHHVRRLPRPPAYAAPELTRDRWATAAVSLAAAAFGTMLLIVLLVARGPRRNDESGR